MASKYKDDSGGPEPPREGVGAGHNSQNQNESDAAPSANLSAPQRAKPIFGRRPTLGDLIGWYAGSILQAKQRRHGSHRHLVSLTAHLIAKKVADKLTAAALVRHARDRRSMGTSPLTIAQDFNLIHTVLEAARREGLIALDLTFFKEARRQCRQDELIVYQAKTPPRVTDAELSDLTVYFTRGSPRAELPMNDLMWFAIHSTRRVSEICRLEWQDTNDRDLTGIVRDSLLPHDAAAKHRRFKMTKDACLIIERQPKSSEYIFPYLHQAAQSLCVRAEAVVAAAPDARAKLRAMIWLQLDCLLNEQTRDFYAVLLFEWREMDATEKAPLTALRKRYFDVWHCVLEECDGQDLLRAETKATQFMLHGAINWATTWYKPEGRLSLDDYALLLEEMVLAARCNTASGKNKSAVLGPGGSRS